MTIIDLREIPAVTPKSTRGGQFELFARDFLAASGFRVLEGPDEGQDDGRDLLVEEEGGITRATQRWLVSAKHFAHSGKAVRRGDESDIEGRLAHFRATGFMGFYSTVPSAALGRRLRTVETRARVFLYDPGRISGDLMSKPALDHVFRRYLPRTYDLVHAPRLQLSTEIGESFPKDRSVLLNLSEILAPGEDGRLQISDPELEDIVTACVLADALRRGKFLILKQFISFRPLVWSFLTQFIAGGKVDERALASEISPGQKTAYLRLLLAVAGVVGGTETAEPICKCIMSTGRYHMNEVALWPVPVTPFFDVAKNALGNMSPSVVPVVEEFRAKAKAARRWKEKEIFEWSLRQLQRRARESNGADGKHSTG